MITRYKVAQAPHFMERRDWKDGCELSGWSPGSITGDHERRKSWLPLSCGHTGENSIHKASQGLLSRAAEAGCISRYVAVAKRDINSGSVTTPFLLSVNPFLFSFPFYY